jgi:hypothetical protein
VRNFCVTLKVLRTGHLSDDRNFVRNEDVGGNAIKITDLAETPVAGASSVISVAAVKLVAVNLR